ncbi:hypothetical protein DSM104299_00990 [Baekduia alba]|nr:hypothetical protein DSM104299_00990 [Baekduia alba]
MPTPITTTGWFPQLDEASAAIDGAEAARRDRIVAAAADAGKITATDTGRTSWREAFDEDPAGTERLLTASASNGGLAAAKFAPTGQPTSTGLFPHLDEVA